jgi:hypothetical protein
VAAVPDAVVLANLSHGVKKIAACFLLV